MNFHIIIDHPWEGSFNFAILDSVIKGIKEKNKNFDVLDLNRENFNPVMSEKELALYAQGKFLDPKVKEYQKRLINSDYLIFIFPIWWNVMPVMLKGWMDKVLLPGFAFTTDQVPQPLLKKITGASVLTTTGTPDEYHRKEYNNALKWVLCEGTLKFCGINKITWLNFGDAGFTTREKHNQWIKTVGNHITELIP